MSGSLTEVDDELSDLETGDPLFPPDADTPSALKVVPIHDHMDEQVQSDRNPRDCGETDELGVAQQSGRAMMVRMKERWAR